MINGRSVIPGTYLGCFFTTKTPTYSLMACLCMLLKTDICSPCLYAFKRRLIASFHQSYEIRLSTQRRKKKSFLVTLRFWNFGYTPIRLQHHQKQMRLPLNCLNRAGNSMTAVVNSVFTSFFVLLHLFSICCLFFFVCQQSCPQGSNKP